MLVMTGPQSTDDERGDLAEVAGLHGALLVHEHHVIWPEVTALYRLHGWDACPLALADVALADALQVPMFDLTM
jgi:hypothetical protein